MSGVGSGPVDLSNGPGKAIIQDDRGSFLRGLTMGLMMSRYGIRNTKLDNEHIKKSSDHTEDVRNNINRGRDACH